MTQLTPPFGYTLFCDDIRQEIGRKLTFVGIYMGELIFFHPLPVIIPKICMFVTLIQPFGNQANKVTLRVYPPGEDNVSPIHEQEYDVGISPDFSPDLPSEDKRSVFATPVIFSPFAVNNSGRLKVRISVGDSEPIKCGSLMIREANAEEYEKLAGSQTPHRSGE